MFRSAMFAVLAIALSAMPSFARQVADDDADTTWVIDAASLDSIRRAMAANEITPIEGQSLSQRSSALAPSAPGVTAAAVAESSDLALGPASWWATTLAIAGPLADGFSTVYALNQSGPNARVAEGNGFYHKLFGADVKAGEIMAFKVGQAALFGAIIHYASKAPEHRAKAIGVAIATAGINFFVASQNMRTAATARRLNAGVR